MNITELINAANATVRNHYLGNGGYRRYISDDAGANRKAGNNEYGCADAANILYTTGSFERDPKQRARLVSAIQSFQHKDGLFDEGTHHPIHCTAHCCAALELFDSAPLLPLTALKHYNKIDELTAMLEGLPWVDDPWPAAHEGAGLYAAFILTGNATLSWQNAYFGWLENNTDGKYGIGLKGAIEKGVRPVSHHLNGWFHYLFNFVFAHRPIPFARQAVDTCIELYRDGSQLVKDFGSTIGFAEIDWVYTAHRACAQEGHRTGEVKELLIKFAKGYIDYLFSVDFGRDGKWNDLHLLFGCMCALAELQIALPGEIVTEYPLKLVLDRRPFI